MPKKNSDIDGDATPSAPVNGDQPPQPPQGDAPQNCTGDAGASRSDILDYIVAETQPAELPQQWQFLTKSPSVRRLSGDRRDLVASLQQQFCDDDLVKARVLIRGQDSELQLSPVFGDSSSKFLLLYDENDKPIDAVSARGLLSTCLPPCVRFALVPRPKEAARKPQGMILASTDDDLHVFHQLGFSCMSAAGLEQLSGEHARRLFGPSALTQYDRKYFFRLPGWQIAEVVNEPTTLTQQYFSHLWKMEQVYGFNPSRLFDVWRPNEEHFSALQSALEFVDAKVVREILVLSFGTPMSTPAQCWNKIMDTADTDLPSARAELLRAIDRSRSSPRRREVRVAADRLRRAIEQSVTAKFYAKVAATPDPFEQMLLLMVSEIAEDWIEGHELLATAEMVIAGEQLPCRGVIDDDYLDQRLLLGDALLKIRRELLRRTH